MELGVRCTTIVADSLGLRALEGLRPAPTDVVLLSPVDNDKNVLF